MNDDHGWILCGDGPAAYEKHIVPAFSGAWAEDMVKRAALRNGERVLDLACGTGIVSRHALQFLGTSGAVTGVDVNAAVLEKAREICPPDAAPVEWKQADAAALPFSDAVFDVALCQQGLQYFPDRSRALKEIKRILVPGGRIVFSVWRSIDYSPFYQALHHALARYVSPEAAEMLSSAYALSDADELKALFTSAGFKRIELSIVIKQMRCPSLKEFLGGGFAASPFAEEISALPEAKHEKLLQMVRNAVVDYIDDKGLAAPMESHLISARKQR